MCIVHTAFPNCSFFWLSLWMLKASDHYIATNASRIKSQQTNSDNTEMFSQTYLEKTVRRNNDLAERLTKQTFYRLGFFQASLSQLLELRSYPRRSFITSLLTPRYKLSLNNHDRDDHFYNVIVYTAVQTQSQ